MNSWALKEYPQYGTPGEGRGALVVAERDGLPFHVRRVYWVHGAQGFVERGGHAHRKTDQVFFCVAGGANWLVTDPTGSTFNGWIHSPTTGILVPHMCWHSFYIQKGSVILALASELYDETDYIRSYDDWQSLVPARA